MEPSPRRFALRDHCIGRAAALWIWLCAEGAAGAYSWSNVVLGGGGPFTGVQFHPKVPKLAYLRTARGGFFRLDEGERLVPLLDRSAFFQQNLFGGEALAVDPREPGLLYLAAGKELDSDWGEGVLLRSQDRGRTLLRLGLRVPMGAAAERPWQGERLAVSPGHPEVLLFASRKSGLWRSADGGASFAQVEGLPRPPADLGAAAVLFDPQPPGLLYLNLYDDGVYASDDEGLRFRRLQGSPSQVLHMAVARDGALLVTSHSPQGVFRRPRTTLLDDAPFSDITPPGAHPGFGLLAVDPEDAQHLVVAYEPGADERERAGLWRSIDGGRGWQRKERFRLSGAAPWWSAAREPFAAAVSALAFDPAAGGRLLLAERHGLWRSDDLAADAPAFSCLSGGGAYEGQEVTSLLALPGGKLLSGVSDADGFLHDRGPALAPSAPLRGARYQTTYDLALADGPGPLRLWRVGGTRGTIPPSGGVASSSDGGRSWSAAPAFPAATLPLRIAVGARRPGGPASVVVLTESGALLRSDGGAGPWSASQLPAPPAALALPDGAQPLCADRAAPERFYYYSAGKLLMSQDGGRSFAVIHADLPQERFAVLRAAPGRPRELWLALSRHGLLRSTDGGQRFTPVPRVRFARLLSFGAPAPGAPAPALYLYGTLDGDADGQPAVYRSTDAPGERGQSWLRVSSGALPFGAAPQVLEASRDRFGHVYLGTAGRGILYGSP